MPLIHPRFILLDTATLANMSRDFWSEQEKLRCKSRDVISRLRDEAWYITFTLAHVQELLSHEDDSVVRGRIAFLRQLPFIAWLRPYDRNWFPGGIPDLLRRELHCVVHDEKKS